jgi:CRP-like cAMP-binding protein
MNALSPEPTAPVNETDLSKIVSKHPFLEGMEPRLLSSLTEAAMLYEFKKGEVIFREGDIANRFFLIRSGKVALESREEEREPHLIAYLGAGDVVGWSWLFSPYYWRFDARAVEDTSAIFFYGTRLREQSEADTALGYELMKRMAQVVIQRLQATRLQLLKCQKS